MRKLNLAGQVFGKLTVETEGRNQNGQLVWHCRCECGAMTAVRPNKLRSGYTKSCGCLVTAKKSDQSEDAKVVRRTKAVWGGMIRRCQDSNHITFPHYGGRGIRVCDRWAESFDNFLVDMGPVPDGMELERRDPDAGYQPDNCCWVPAGEQTNNRRNTVRLTRDGVTKSVRDWAVETGIPYATLSMRVYHGWSAEEALSLPVGSRRPVAGPASSQRQARHRVDALVKSGVLVRPEHCQHPGCTNPKVDGHHHRGYEGDAAVDVVWLCRAHHPHPKEKEVTWQGRTQTLRQWARETGVPRATIYNRLVYRDWVVDDSVFAPVWHNQSKMITHDGVTLSITAWAKRLGIGERTIQTRLKRGLPPAEILAPTRYSLSSSG